MIEKRFLVMDIETITDYELARQVFNLPAEATLEEIREQIRNKYTNGFAPPPFHIPICIALMDVDAECCKVHNATVLEGDEKPLLQQFWRVFRYRKGNIPVRTTVVHFNGRGFDLPVIMLRSLKHRIPVATWERSRYSFENSHDVCDDLSEFGAASRPSLDVLSKMLGLAGKTDVQGSQVEELYLRGERTKIKDYCMDDTLNTYYVWLTIKLIRGELSEEKYQDAFQSAAEAVRQFRTQTDAFFSLP